MAVGSNALGEYLRARRGQVRPEDVGLVAGARRRVRGLRREELATLAGISSEYYLRLEQGRDKNPSAQILDALARALRLDTKASEYLHQLASSAGGRRDHESAEVAADGTDELIEQFAMPAIVASRCQDVLAANSIARALSPGFAPGQNFLRWRLLEPAARDFFVDWDEATDVAVSGLREAAGSDPEDPRLRSVIDELSAASERFRELWARADVGYRVGVIHMRHPKVGDLYLHRNRFNIPHSGGQHLLSYRAEPGSESAVALDALRAWARTGGMDNRAEVFATTMADQIELSPTDWVRAHTEKILKHGTTDGVEVYDRPIVLVTITGGKSGKQRYVPLMRVEKDGRYAIVASKGGAPAHPSWYFNLKVNPEVTVQDGDKVVTLTAREIGGTEREQWWRLAVEAFPPYAEYQTKTARQIPVFILE